MCDAAGAAAWSYDSMGRALTEKRLLNTSVTKTIGYTYNLDGSLATLVYPSLRTITYAPGGAGRALAAKDTANSINYVTSAAYAPFGGMTGITDGLVTGTFNGIITTNTYNKRLQPITLSAATTGSGGQTVLSLSYDFHSGVGDNGNVFQIVNNRDNNRTQNFAYDALNRLSQANTTGPNWGETFTIDPWGNLTNRGPVTGKTSYEALNAPAASNNQISGYCYDIAGNMLGTSPCPSLPYSPFYSYDAENRIRILGFSASPQYLYDGDGKRVIKTGIGNMLYWTGTGSETLTETNLSGTPAADYIYFNGKRVARVDLPGGTVRYYFSDHLGTASVVTDNLGVIKDESDYYPYGGERTITDTDSNRYKFTGKERDTESGLDNFGARYDASSMGRFMTPDPVSATPPHLVNPQRWNMYSYVVNNPLTYVDPDGRDAIAVNFVNEVPLGGHEGIIVVHADGSATYARFGPQHAGSPADQGKVDVQQLNPVTFRDDGLPTVESYKELSDEVAKIEGQAANTVGFNYFKTSEADSIALDNWMQAWKNAHSPDYQVNKQNCATFCIAGLLTAHAVQNKGLSIIPNRLFMILAGLSAENYADGQRSKPKEKVTTRIVGCQDMQGHPCTQ